MKASEKIELLRGALEEVLDAAGEVKLGAHEMAYALGLIAGIAETVLKAVPDVEVEA